MQIVMTEPPERQGPDVPGPPTRPEILLPLSHEQAETVLKYLARLHEGSRAYAFSQADYGNWGPMTEHARLKEVADLLAAALEPGSWCEHCGDSGRCVVCGNTH